MNLDDGTITVSGLINNSLSYNCLNNNRAANGNINSNTLFIPAHHHTMLLNNNLNDKNDSYNYLNQTNNLRRSIFKTNNFQSNKNQAQHLASSTLAPRNLLSNNNSAANTNKLNSQFIPGVKVSSNNQAITNNNGVVLNDPLGHIYETISISSGMNGVNLANSHRFMTNKFMNRQNNQQQLNQELKNPYNEIEFDYKPVLNFQEVNNNNEMNDDPLINPNLDHQNKSQEVFLISLNPNTHKNTNFRQNRYTNNQIDSNNLVIPTTSHTLMFKPSLSNSNINKNNNNSRITEMNISNMMMMNSPNINSNSPPSCSSSITTTTTSASSSLDSTSNNNNNLNFSHHNQRFFPNNDNSINTFNNIWNGRGSTNQHQQQQQFQFMNHHDMNDMDMFSSRSEAVV